MSGAKHTPTKIEMVDYSSGFEQPAEPMWRIMVGEYCADFSTETAASNFGAAIDAELSTLRDVLRDCLDYFEQRMDAETFPDGSIITNEEMQMSLRIKEALR